MRYLRFPYLPENKVSCVMVDKRAYDNLVYSLEDLGIKVVVCESCNDLHWAISSHPDILYFHYEYNLIFAAPNSPRKTTEELKKLGFNIIYGEEPVEKDYPQDVKYNIAKVGKRVFHNFKFTDKIVAKKIEEDNLQKIHIKQGYAKCSILIVSTDAIITSDRGIYKKAVENGVDCLLISPGFIKLEGMNYGFIGGCAGLISNNIMAFNGDVSMHPDYIEIKNFLKKYNIEILNIAGLQLSDIGSIIPLCQW